MTRQEYALQMQELCNKQTEKKIAHLANLEDIEMDAARRIREVRDSATLARREAKSVYIVEMGKIEQDKQNLKTAYVMEHPEEFKCKL